MEPLPLEDSDSRHWLKAPLDGGVTVTVTLPLPLVHPPMLHVAVYVVVAVGETLFDVPVPRPLDQVIVPPEQPLADNVELDPDAMVEGLADNDGADGAEQLCAK
jgi:hypothetical protein